MEVESSIQPDDHYQARLLRVMLHIQQHLDDPMTLDELASVAHFSPFHFHRIFSAITGETLMSHIRRLRLERAAHLLLRTSRTVSDLASAYQYENHESFTRAFTKHFGIAPSEFRKQNRPPRIGLTLPTPLERIESGPYRVVIRVFTPIQVAFIKHIGPYEQTPKVWSELTKWAAKNRMTLDTPLAIAYDDPELTPRERLRYDACMEVKDAIQPDGRVGVQTIDGGEYGVITHHGSYSSIGEAYKYLFGVWLPASGREPRNFPPLLRYVTPMFGTPSDELITEVCLPLEQCERSDQ